MGRYCPKCYVGVSKTDTVCENCGVTLSSEPSGTEAFDLSEKIDITEAEIEEVTENDQGLEIVPTVNEEEPDQNTPVSEITSEVKGSVYEEPIPHDYENKAELSNSGDLDKTMSFGEWMLTLLLTYIPIVNIIMLIIWSIDAKTNPNKKHFAWATLVFMAIGVVVSVIFSTLFVGLIFSSMDYYYY